MNRFLSSGPVLAIGISALALALGFFVPLVIGLRSVSEDGARDKPPALVITDEAAVRPPASRAAEGGDVAVAVSAAGGEHLYNAYCVACHQAGGSGKVGFAPFIRNRDFLALASDDFLRGTIIGGRPGTAMVGWGHLKPQEIDSLVAYLRSAEEPGTSRFAKADPAKSYPGEADRGHGLFSIYCASCHGQNATGYAEGGAGPAIGNPGFLAVAADDFIFQTVKHGRAGTSMRGFSGAAGLADLSDGEIGDIIAYLRSRDASVPVVAERPADAKAGHLHYNANCAACHQPDGSGKPGFAPSIRNADFLAIASDDFIKQTVRHGRPGTAMVQRPDLSDQVLGDIVAYLRSLPGGQTPDITVDPSKDLASLGDAQHGLQVYGSYCIACHGEGGKGYVAGGPGTAIGLSGFLAAASDDYIFQTVKQGRAGTAMRPFVGARGLANLSEQEVYDVIAYLRDLN